jgi:sortase A
MNSDHNPKSSHDHPPSGPEHAREREAAANVARHHINNAYDQATGTKVDPGSAYDRTYTNTTYDWNQYHVAWQQYYQLYYQRYYLHQLHNNSMQQQTIAAKAYQAAEKTTDTNSNTIFGSDSSAPAAQTIRNRLLSIITDRAKRARHSNHFVPFASALAVGAVFLFLQYNRVAFAEFRAYVSPGSTVAQSDVLVDPTANLNVGAEPKLIIPKIDVDAKVNYDVATLNDGPIQAGLRDGVVHYNLPGANSLPGQVGNTVLLGHSSNDIFDPGDSKFVFVLLDHMEMGDVFYVHYNGTRYIYRVTDKKVIKPTDISALQVSNSKPMVTLVTCTPLGTDLKRLLVFGEQISPDPAAAKIASTADSAQTAKPAVLPGSSPTFLDNIYNFFFGLSR